MSTFSDNLIDGEKLCYAVKPHWIVFYQPIIWLAASVLLLILGPALTNYINLGFGAWNIFKFAALLAAIVAIVMGISAYVVYLTSEFCVTNRRVLMKTGLLRQTTTDLLLQRIEGVSTSQTLLGKLLGYGSILISGTGGSRDLFHGIPNPAQFRNQIQQQIQQQTNVNPGEN